MNISARKQKILYCYRLSGSDYGRNIFWKHRVKGKYNENISSKATIHNRSDRT